MKDHQIAQVVNQLRDIAIKYHATEQLRAQIHAVIVPLLKATDQVARDKQDAANGDRLMKSRTWKNRCARCGGDYVEWKY